MIHQVGVAFPQRVVRRLIVLLTLTLTLCFGASFEFAQAQAAAELSESTFRDAILGRVELTEAERASLDLNDDGLLDVADLVFFLKDIGSPTPIASFENMSTVALEGVRAVSVSVAFTNTFHGTLRYTVSGGDGHRGR